MPAPSPPSPTRQILWAEDLAFGIVTHLFVLAYEEPTLRSTYGAQYEAYAADVRRWLPRLTPWRSGAPWRPTPPA